ncbi:MAG: hypothetical protein ABSE57_05675 [Bryobacteraceae bacterium]
MTVLIAFVAALAGGVISRYAAPAPVHAQQAQAPPPAPVERRAQRFALVNPGGGVVATFVVDQSNPTDILAQPSIRLLDWNGKEIWSAGGSPVRKLALK